MTVLVVRHGPGRGRMDNYLEVVFDDLRRREVADAVRVHETGQPEPSLDGVAAVAFMLADPLLEAYPRCYAEATAIAAEARDRGLHVVNPPEALSNTVKSRQSAIWQAAGFETPAWTRYESSAELKAIAAELPFPLFVRSDESHAQHWLALARDRKELKELDWALFEFPAAVAPVVDVRAGYRERDPDSIFARLFHTRRSWVLGDRLFQDDLFFSRHPIVAGSNNILRRWDRVPGPLKGLHRLQRHARAAVREDVAHWRNGEPQGESLVAAARALGLEFAAIDYTRQADGRLMLWEANAHPYLAPRMWYLPRQRGGMDRVAGNYRAIGDFFLALA